MTTGPQSSTGLDANLAAALSYLLGILTGIVFYALEKDSRFVKFHAMQSILVSLAVIVAWIVYSILVNVLLFIPILGWIAIIVIWAALSLAGLALWIFLMVKAFQGETYKLPYLGDIAEKQIG